MLSVVDERSAAFKALGIALATQKPAAVVCTSGSAAVNFYPAVVEAYYQGVPLIMLTADRPQELIDRWDGQAIRQRDLFGSHVKISISTPEDYSNTAHFIETARFAWTQSMINSPGPVHINVPLHEPLYSINVLPGLHGSPVDEIRAQKTANVEIPDDIIAQLRRAKKPMLLIGHRTQGDPDTEWIQYLSEKGWTILADVASQVASAQPERAWENALLLNKLPELFYPDFLISTGTSILSKKLRNHLRANNSFVHYHMDESGYAADPFFTKPGVLPLNPSKISEFVMSFEENKVKLESFEKMVNNSLQTLPFGEFKAVVSLLTKLKSMDVLHLANSMPVRYAAYAMSVLGTSKVYANRGVSGIDGCVSTAVGASLADPRNIHYLITGDLAFFYDSNGLWQAALPNNLRILLLNNGGGGIFDILEGPKQQPVSMPYQTTPQLRSAINICIDHKIIYRMAEDEAELNEGMRWLTDKKSGCRLLEVFSKMEENTEIFNTYKHKINEQTI